MQQAPPHDTNVEAAVLGAMLMGHADECVGLCAEDFYNPAHAHIFGVISDLHNEGQPTDQVTVASKLPRQVRQLVLELADNYLPVGLESHVEMLRDYSRRRATIRECRRIEALAHEEDAIPEAMQAFMRLADSGARQSVSIADVVNARLDVLSERRPYFLPPDGGPHIKAGNFVVIGGRPGTGKSALALWWALEWSRTMRVAIYSYEMDEEEIADRLISYKTGTPIETLDDGYSRFEVDVFRDHMRELAGHRLSIKVAAGLSTAQLYSSLRTFRAAGGQVAIIDYLQLAMEHTKAGETADLTRLSNGLRRLALSTGLTIIALSQLNREMEGRTGKEAYPRLSDLRSSGSLEQDATAVMLMYRYPDAATDQGNEARDDLRRQGWLFDRHDSRALIRIHWAKVRQGATRTSLVMFDGGSMRFDPIDRALSS